MIDHNPMHREAANEDGVIYIEGHASDDDILTQAGIQRAAAVIACVDSDAENIFVALSARELSTSVTLDGHVGDTHFMVGGGEGRLIWPEKFPDPLTLHGLTLRVAADDGLRHIAVQQFDLQLQVLLVRAQGLDPFPARHGQRQRLLAHHMQPGLERGNREFGMKRIRRGDHERRRIVKRFNAVETMVTHAGKRRVDRVSPAPLIDLATAVSKKRQDLACQETGADDGDV